MAVRKTQSYAAIPPMRSSDIALQARLAEIDRIEAEQWQRLASRERGLTDPLPTTTTFCIDAEREQDCEIGK